MDFLIDVIEKCNGLEPVDKLKLILVASGVKPATFVPLKVYPKNLGVKPHLEKHLKDHGFLFKIGNPRSFEEIDKIQKNKIFWSLKGVWYGFDVFRDKKHQKLFKEYRAYVKRKRQDKADKAAGRLYDYPQCCVKQFIRENDLNWIKKNYSYYDYYKRLHDSERKFPFILHTACSANCKESRKLNTKYKNAVKKHAPKFYKEFSKKKNLISHFMVEGRNNIITDINGTPLWESADGGEYNLVAMKKFKEHYYQLAHLDKKKYSRGDVLSGAAEMQFNFADIKVKKKIRHIKNLVHIRKFRAIGRKY